MNEKSPDPAVARVRALCANCRNLGTVEVPGKPGLHVLCAECANLHGGPKRQIYAHRDEYRDPPTLPFTLPPEPVVSEAERAAADAVVEAALQPVMERAVAVVERFERTRADDLSGRLVASFCAGLASGVALLGVLLWLV